MATTFCAIATSARAESPRVTAVLTSSETSVGRPVQLQIKITGGSSPKPPGEIDVEGLEIRSAGVSREYQMNNFSVSYSFTYNYVVTPSKAGTFKIPPQRIEVSGQSLQTPELSLNVLNSSSQSTRPGRGGTSRSASNIDPAQIGFVELILPKTTAYVGEVLPAQARLGLNMRAPIESLGSGVQIDGQGFTTQKMPEPRQTMESINGRSYQMFIFNTAISAVRAGKLEIGPAEATPTVRVARSGQVNPSLPRDLQDDPFFNSFFNDPAFAPSVRAEVPLKSPPAMLEVKPLPPKAPPGFSGAVGTFTLKVEANPKKAQVGDPITVKATIIGRGNFDRVIAPILEDDRGWHAYPPSENFKQDDDVGISGTKTFELVLSAKDRKNKLPPLAFTFFDPVKEAYVTMKSDEIPLAIEGASAPAATPAVAQAAPSSSAARPTAATPAPAKEQDILYQLNDRPAANETFAARYLQPIFWAAQALPLLALLGFIGWKIRQSRLGNREARRTASLQHEAAELQRGLKRDGSSPQEYFAKAARAVQVKTALARNLDPNQVDAETAATAFRLDEKRSASLRQLFQERDELAYSGGGDGNGKHAVSPEKRREIFELVEHLRG
ncbi:MAG: BatD family protein [Chthoniobacterales bacterium]